MAFEPRDGKEAIGGIPWLARMIDKARATANGTAEDYIYPCPLDQKLLDQLDLTAEQFSEIVLENADDQGIIDRVKPRYNA